VTAIFDEFVLPIPCVRAINLTTYVLLSDLGFPDQVSPDDFFTALRRSASSDAFVMTWAVLADDGNALGLGLLRGLGFKRDETLQVTLADGRPRHFYSLDPGGILDPLPASATMVDGHEVITVTDHLVFRGLEPQPVVQGTGEVLLATELDLMQLFVDQGFLRPTGRIGLNGAKFADDAALHEFRLGVVAEVPGDDDDGSSGLIKRPAPGFRFVVEVGEAARFLRGPRLLQEATPLVASYAGEMSGRLAIESRTLSWRARRLEIPERRAAAVVAPPPGGGADRFRIECILQNDARSLQLGTIPGFFVGFAKEGLRYGAGEESIDIFPIPGTRGVRPSFTLSPVMAGVVDPLSKKVATFVEASTPTGGLVPGLLNFDLPLRLPGDWDFDKNPLFSLGAADGNSAVEFAGTLLSNADVRIENFALPAGVENVFLPAQTSDLKALTGESGRFPEFKLNIESPPAALMRSQKLSELRLPLLVDLNLGTPGENSVKFLGSMPFDLVGNLPRQRENRVYLYFWSTGADGDTPEPDFHAVDFGFLRMEFPKRRPLPTSGDPPTPGPEDCDAYIDAEHGEIAVVLRPHRNPGVGARTRDEIVLLFPGGLQSNLPPEEDQVQRQKRFGLKLKSFSPSAWPNEPKAGDDPPIFFRLRPKGISFEADVSDQKVVIDSGPHLNREVALEPLKQRGDVAGRIVVIDNKIALWSVPASMVVPGTDNLIADVTVTARQDRPGATPIVEAGVVLSRPDETPVARLSVGAFEMAIDKPHLTLSWQGSTWDFDATADATLSFHADANIARDLEGLRRKSSITVRDLDLRRMNLATARVDLDLVDDVTFDVLDGLIGIRLTDLSFEWAGSKLQKLACNEAHFAYNNPGVLTVELKASGLRVELGDGPARLKIDPGVGITIKAGEGFEFNGECGFVEGPRRRYFSAGGGIKLSGMPRSTALVQIGKSSKNDGTLAEDHIFYGARDFDIQVFSGVVVKSLGMGIGINERLTAIGPDPTAAEILQNIDRIVPGDRDSWSFVPGTGDFFSIIATAELASNQGPEDLVYAYVLSAVFSIDPHLNVVAATKIWVSSSLANARAYPNNPVLVGAVVMNPRRRSLEARLESRPNPVIQDNKLLEKILTRGRLRMSFRLTPELVDYFLEEVSYQDRMFGFDWQVRGSFRIAIFRGTVLTRASVALSGRVEEPLRVGSGGADVKGNAGVSLDYGGLLRGSGAVLFAQLDAHAALNAGLFLEVSFKIFKRRFSKTFRASAGGLEVGIRGGIGVNAAGLVGGYTGARFSFRICNHGLGGEAGVEFSPEAHDEARAEVAAFAADLDAAIANFRHDALTNRLRPRSLATFVEPPYETWNHLQALENNPEDGAYHLLFPADTSRWLTPVVNIARRKTIAQVQPGSPIRIMTTEPHRLHSGDRVEIRLVDSVPAANGTWAVEPDRLSLHKFTLVGSSAVAGDPTDEHEGSWRFADDRGLDRFVGDVTEVTVDYGRAAPIAGWDASIAPAHLHLPGHGLAEVDRILVSDVSAVPALNGDWIVDRVDDDWVSLRGSDRPTATSRPRGDGIWGRASEASSLTLRMPWVTENWSGEGAPGAEELDQLHQLQAMFRETADDHEDKRIEKTLRAVSLSEPTVFTDPRPESNSEQFVRPEDRNRRPYVLSYNWLSADELEAQLGQGDFPGDPGDLQRVRDFENAKAEARDAALRAGLDRDPAARLKDARSSIVARAVHALSEPGDVKEFGPFGAARDRPIGLIFRLPTGDRPLRIEIKRRGEGTMRAILLSPDGRDSNFASASVDLVSRIEPQGLRQQFVVDRQGDDRQPETGKVFVKLPLKYDHDLLTRDLARLGAFNIYRKVGDAEEELAAEACRPAIDEVVTEEGMRRLIVHPFVFTDEFPTEGRAFTRDRLIADKTEIQYRFEPIPNGAGSKAQMAPASGYWIASMLHIPEPDTFPGDLTLVFGVENLVARSPDSPETRSLAWMRYPSAFRIAVPKDEGFEAAKYRGRWLEEGDFELFAFDQPLQRGGFYGLGDIEESPTVAADASKVRVRDVRTDRPMVSLGGKFPVPVGRVPGSPEVGPPVFRFLDLVPFRVGRRYQFFIRRLDTDDPDGLIQPMRVRLAAILPLEFTPSTPLKPAFDDKVEWIAPAVWERVRRRSPEFRGSFSVAATYRQGRNRLRAAWWGPSPANEGGVELIVRDHDESTRVARQLVEVTNERLFRRNERDFAGDSDWVLSEGQTRDRLPGRPFPLPKPGASDQATLLDAFVDLDPATNLVIEKLDVYSLALLGRLDSIVSTDAEYEWSDLYAEIHAWLLALQKFRRTPLNLKEPAFQAAVAAVTPCVRAAMMGLQGTILAGTRRAVTKPGTRRSFVADSVDGINVGDLLLFPQPTARELREVVRGVAAIDRVTKRVDVNDDWPADPAAGDEFVAFIPGGELTLAEQFAAEERAVLKEVRRIEKMQADENDVNQPNDLELARRAAGCLRNRKAVASGLEALASPDAPQPRVLMKRHDGAERLPREADWIEIELDAREQGPDLPITRALLARLPSGKYATPAISALRVLVARLRTHVVHPDAVRRADLAAVVPQARGLLRVVEALEDAIRPSKVVKRPHHQVGGGEAKDGQIRPGATPASAFLPDSAHVRAPDEPILDPDGSAPTFQLSPTPEITRRLLFSGYDSEAEKHVVRLMTVEAADGVTQFNNLHAVLKRVGPLSSVGLIDKEEQQLAFVVTDEGASVFDVGSGRRFGTTYVGVTCASWGAMASGLRLLTAISVTINSDERAAIVARTPGADASPDDPTYHLEATNDRRLVSVAADDRGRVILAGSDGGKAYVWSTASPGDPQGHFDAGADTEHVNAVAFALLPEGLRLLTGTSGGYVRMWKPQPGEPAAVMIDEFRTPHGVGVCSLAYDPRLRRVAVGTASEDLFVLNALDLGDATTRSIPGSVQTIARFLTVHEPVPDVFTTGVVAAGSNGAVTYWQPAGGEHETEVPVVAAGDSSITPALAVARMRVLASTQSRSVVRFFNLLERLGFAVDLTLTSATGEPFDADGIVGRIRKALGTFREVGTNGRAVLDGDHLAFLLDAREPDTGERGAGGLGGPVGYSFAKLAIVPSAFYSLLLGDVTDSAELRPWFQLRGVTLGEDPTAVRILRQFRDLARYVGVPAPDSPVRAIRLEPRSSRWLTLPSLGGRTTTIWPVPDRKGHRYEVAARRVSRYEPLIEWAVGITAPFPDPPREVQRGQARPAAIASLGWAIGTDTRDIRVSDATAVPSAGALIRIEDELLRVTRATGSTWTIERGVDWSAATTHDAGIEILGGAPANNQLRLARTASRRQGDYVNRVLEVFDTCGASQLRRVVAYDANDAGERLATVEPPWDRLPPLDAEYRVLEGYWADVEVLPIVDAARGEGTRPVTVVAYQLPAKVQFSFQAPPPTARSLVNQISKVRTGDRGHEVIFRHTVLDRAPDRFRHLNDLLAALVPAHDEMGHPAERPLRCEEIGLNEAAVNRLLHSERELSFDDVPHYFGYQLDVRRLVRAREVDPEAQAVRLQLPQGLEAGPSSLRGPRLIGQRRPELAFLEPALAVLVTPNPDTRNQVTLRAGETPPSLTAGVAYLLFDAIGDDFPKAKSRLITNYDEPTGVATVYPEWDAINSPPTWYLVRGRMRAIVSPPFNDDHLTPDEKTGSPPPPTRDVPLGIEGIRSTPVPIPDLPDFVMAFRMYWEPELPGANANEVVYLDALRIELPWSRDFPTDFPTDNTNERKRLAYVKFGGVKPESDAADLSLPIKVYAGELIGTLAERMDVSASTIEIDTTPGTTIAEGQRIQVEQEVIRIGPPSHRGWSVVRDPARGTEHAPGRPVARLYDRPTYFLEFDVTLDASVQSRTFWDPRRFFLKGTRDGAETRVMGFKVWPPSVASSSDRRRIASSPVYPGVREGGRAD
jgi:hypothetical protein